LGEKKSVEALVSGGKATGGPPLGPALGPLGVNVVTIVNKINELTNEFSGIKVPVKVIVDVETKSFDVHVGTPPTAALAVKELGVEKGSGSPKEEKVGDLTLDQVKRIAQIKLTKMYAKDLKAAIKEVAGTCVSMGVTIDGKESKEFLKELDEGVYDSSLQG